MNFKLNTPILCAASQHFLPAGRILNILGLKWSLKSYCQPDYPLQPFLCRNNKVAIETPGVKGQLCTVSPTPPCCREEWLRGGGASMWLVLGHNVFRQRYYLSQKLQHTSAYQLEVHVLKGLVPSWVQQEEARNPKRWELVRGLLVIENLLSRERAAFLFFLFTLGYYVIPK